MATFQITIPGQGKFRVSGVESEADAWNALQGQIGNQQEQPDPSSELAKEYSWPEAALIGAGKGLTDVWEGTKGIVGMGRSEAERAEAERLYAPLKKEYPSATGVGEAAPFIAAGGLAGVGRNLLGTIGRQVLGGAAVGATMEGDIPERMARAGTEGLIAGVGGAVGHVAGRAIGLGLDQLGPAVQRNVQSARDLGYRVLPTTGLPGRNLKQVVQGSLETMPGSAYLLDQLSQHNQSTLARAAINAIGETGDELTEATLANARRRTGAVMSTVARNTPTVDVTGVVQDVNRIARERVAPMIVGPEDPVGTVVQNTLAYLTEAAGRGGATGREIFRQQSAIGKRAVSADKTDPNLAAALRDLQQSLLRALEDSAPANMKGRMQTARQQYRTLMQLETGQNVDPVMGKVFPGRLSGTLTKTDRRGFTEGGNRSPLYEGVRFMARQQPELNTSGTTERSAGRELMRSIGAGLGVGGAGGAIGGDPVGGAAAGGGMGALLGFALPNVAARAYLHPMAYEWMRREASPAIRNLINMGVIGGVRSND